jgi:MFS family permease
VLFEIGSLICTLAPTSAIFILGRALSGLGRGAINGGMFKLLRFCFPLSKQALVTSVIGGVQSVGLVLAPTIGGGLVDAISWRACFGINLPLGVICIVLTAFGTHDPVINSNDALPLKEKLKKIQLTGTLLMVPAITVLLMALQWGGTKYGWGSWRIILLLVLSVALLAGFGYLQYRQGDNAYAATKDLETKEHSRRYVVRSMQRGGSCCNRVLHVYILPGRPRCLSNPVRIAGVAYGWWFDDYKHRLGHWHHLARLLLP